MSGPAEQSSQPVLTGGVVYFASAVQFLDIFDKTLTRGALAVTSSDSHEPLAPFDIEMIVAGTLERIRAQAQVVSSRSGVLLLSIVDEQQQTTPALAALAERLREQASSAQREAEPEPAQDAPTPLTPAPVFMEDRPPAPVSAPAPAPEPEPEPAAAPPPEPEPETAPPPEPEPTAASQPEPKPETAAAPQPEPEPAPQPKPEAAPALAVLSGKTLVFADKVAVVPALAEVEKTGGLMAQAIGKLPDFGSIALEVSLSSGQAGGEANAEVVFAQGEQVALVFPNPGNALAVLRALAPATAPPPQPAETKAPGSAEAGGGSSRGLTISKRPMQNPDSPPALLQLNLAKPPDPRQHPRPTMLETIFGIARLRGMGTLKIWHDEESLEIPFRTGIMLLSEEERERVLLASLASVGQIEMVPSLPARISSDKRPKDPRGVVADCLRQSLRVQRAQDLEIALGSLMERYPNAAQGASPVMLGLKLEPKEARFFDVVLDGSRRLEEIPRVAGLLRPATFRLIYVLLAYSLIEFADEPSFDSSEDPKKLYRQECERLLKANPFELLGVHWSEHPNAIRDKYQRRRELYAASNDLAKSCSDLAKKVANAMERTFNTLMEREGRKQARQALGNLDLKGASHILAKHAELASMREDLRTVKESLEMAMELYPSKDTQQLMRDLLSR